MRSTTAALWLLAEAPLARPNAALRSEGTRVSHGRIDTSRSPSEAETNATSGHCCLQQRMSYVSLKIACKLLKELWSHVTSSDRPATRSYPT